MTTARHAFRRAGAVFMVALAPALLAACFPADPAHVQESTPARAPLASLDTVRLDTPARASAVPSLNSPGRVETEAEAPSIGPESLIGLDAAALRRTVGTPTLTRREARAEVWQYQAASCVMDAFFYATPGGDGVPRVTYVELRRNGVAVLTDPEARRACFAEATATDGRDTAAEP